MRLSKRFAYIVVSLLVLLTSVAPPALAQRAPSEIRDTTATTTRRGPSPRSALFKSLIIPGWGQLSVGAYVRGAFFIGAQGASWYMLLKTNSRLSDAKDSRSQKVEFTGDTLRARMALDTALARKLADPVAFDEQVQRDTTVTRLNGLVESRDQQRQDWITYTLFFTFASGVDAYVAAQLADFPATIDAEPTPSGGMQLQVHVPLPRRR